jgi:hypothetical protein
MQAMSSDPNRGTGAMIAGVGRGLASAITKPVAGALELIAHASTAAMLAVQFTPRVAHIEPVGWCQTSMISPPRPIVLKSLSLFKTRENEEKNESIPALTFIPCNIKRVQGNATDGSSLFERAWLIGYSNSNISNTNNNSSNNTHHHQFVFIRHGGRGSQAFQIINASQGRRLPDVLNSIGNVVNVKEVSNSALLKSAKKGDSISTTTVSFLITFQEHEEKEKAPMANISASSSSSTSHTLSSSTSLSISTASKQQSTPTKPTKASLQAQATTPLSVKSPSSSTTPSTLSSSFTLNNFFSSSSSSSSSSPLAPLSPLLSSNSIVPQPKAKDTFDLLVILPVELRYLFSRIVLCKSVIERELI